MSEEPERRARSHRRGDVSPRQRVRDAHLPMRIDDGQAGRPEQLPHVEPQGMRGDEHTLDQRVIEGDGLLGPVERRICGRDRQPHGDERYEPDQVRGHDAVPFPPLPDQQCRGQGHHDGLAQHPQHEQRQRQDVPPRPTLRVRLLREAIPGPEGGQIEQRRKHVLAFEDPRHGLHVQRMDGEHRGHDPRAGDGQPPQHMPQQQGIGGVQQDVDGMIPGRREAPQLMFQPEGRIYERPVVPFPEFQVARREPDAPQAVPVSDGRRLGDDPIVPDEPAPQHGRRIADGDQHPERQHPKDAHPDGRTPRGGRRRFFRRHGSRGGACRCSRLLRFLLAARPAHIAPRNSEDAAVYLSTRP